MKKRPFKAGDLVEIKAGVRLGMTLGPEMNGLSGPGEFAIVIEDEYRDGDESEVRLLLVSQAYENWAFRDVKPKGIMQTTYKSGDELTLIRRGKKRQVETTWALLREKQP